MNNLSVNIIQSGQYTEQKGTEKRCFNLKTDTDLRMECVTAWASGKYKKIKQLAEEKNIKPNTLAYWIRQTEGSGG